MPPTDDIGDLRRRLTHADAVIAELRGVVAGRANWLQFGGDGGLKTAAVLLSDCVGATRHRLNVRPRRA